MQHQKKRKLLRDKESNITADGIENCESWERLAEMKQTLLANMIQVKEQLDTASGRAAATNEYADPEWYAKATSYKRVLGFLHQKLQFKEREFKQAKTETTFNIDRCFVDCAKEILPADQFYKILSEAHTRKQLIENGENIETA